MNICYLCDSEEVLNKRFILPYNDPYLTDEDGDVLEEINDRVIASPPSYLCQDCAFKISQIIKQIEKENM